MSAVHGRDQAAEAEVCVEARDVLHLRQVGAQLELVQSNDAVERERTGRDGVAGAAGQVDQLQAGQTGAGNLAEGGYVGGREGSGRECVQEGVDASVSELAVGEGEFEASVESGRGGRRRGRE